MELIGKIITILPLTTGTGKNGIWKKQDFILATNAQISRKICISVWGDKIDQFGIAEGDEVIVSIDLESREFNSKWYTEVKAWKIVKNDSNSPIPVFDKATPSIDERPLSLEDDLPF